MIERKIICETQFGFRKHHSTSHAINHSINFIKECHPLKKHVIGIFIDRSKAFDTINHNTLLHKLYNYGIRGITHNLIRSYLSNRFQCVKIDDAKSEQLSVQYGVPKGSVLGPLLFLLYYYYIINDLKNVVKIEGTEIFFLRMTRTFSLRAIHCLKLTKYLMKYCRVYRNICTPIFYT